MTETADPFETRARDLLRDTPLIDGHNDLAYALRGRVGLRTSEVDLRQPVPGLDTDIPRLRAGVVGGQFWSVWVPADLPEPEAVLQSLEQMDIVIASVHSHFNQTPAEMTDRLLKAVENPNTSLLGHPTGRMLLRRCGSFRVRLPPTSTRHEAE